MSRRMAVILMLLGLAAITAIAQQDPQVKVPDAEQFVGKPKGTPLTGDDLTRKTQDIAASLRCPVCQGLAIADSPSEMATNMKGQVRELLARGYTQEQIFSYFERSYGQFVLLKPKFQGVNTLVWVLPVLALALGVIIVFAKIRNLEKVPEPKTAAAESAAPAETPEEDPYLARVRELVKGDNS
jgi:cytochrome c-type biogenesis protein CcmH